MEVEKKMQEKTIMESPHDKFKRLATKRTNEVLRKLKILGNCANRQIYEYTDEDVEKIFKAIDRKVREIRANFRSSREQNFKL